MKHIDVFAGVLVGGRGQRLGGVDKARLRWGNTTLVEHMVARLAPHVSQVILAARREQAFNELAVSVVQDGETVTTNPPAQGGPLAGLEALLRQPPAPWCWLVAVDMPFVEGTLLNRLVAARTPGILAVVPKSSHGLEPCAALYHRDLHVHCLQALQSGRRALRQLFAGMPHKIVECEDESLTNINRPEDLALLSRA